MISLTERNHAILPYVGAQYNANTNTTVPLLSTFCGPSITKVYLDEEMPWNVYMSDSNSTFFCTCSNQLSSL